ncbi:hypothetical protein K438DRAFT_1760421 [Mycena galopus ATCC 62051]|nr:hypothetical protein K438DRAFT_1760421 [Mycena galopus ATCC 62051]
MVMVIDEEWMPAGQAQLLPAPLQLLLTFIQPTTLSFAPARSSIAAHAPDIHAQRHPHHRLNNIFLASARSGSSSGGSTDFVGGQAGVSDAGGTGRGQDAEGARAAAAARDVGGRGGLTMRRCERLTRFLPHFLQDKFALFPRATAAAATAGVVLARGLWRWAGTGRVTVEAAGGGSKYQHKYQYLIQLCLICGVVYGLLYA